MIELTEQEALELVKYLGMCRAARYSLDGTLFNEPEIQESEEKVERFLNDKGVFV